MDLLIVTGLSGAGKTQAIHALEDIDYFCIDNIPSEMLGQFMQLCEKSAPKSKIAVGVDIRCVSHFGGFDTAKQQLKDMDITLKPSISMRLMMFFSAALKRTAESIRCWTSR